MAKKKKKSKNPISANERKRRATQRGESLKKYEEVRVESKAAEVTTIAWMVTLLSVVLCLVMAFFALISGYWFPESGLPWLGSMSLFAGALVGVICLILIPILKKIRRMPLPPAIVLFAIVTSLLPMVVMLLRYLFLGDPADSVAS